MPSPHQVNEVGPKTVQRAVLFFLLATLAAATACIYAWLVKLGGVIFSNCSEVVEMSVQRTQEGATFFSSIVCHAVPFSTTVLVKVQDFFCCENDCLNPFSSFHFPL